ncbi:MAG: glycosyltransferase [Bacteroidota bacterium]
MSKKQHSATIFIPAMGSCHHIPKKFVRFLDGKPLLSYSVQVSKQVALAENVVVLSDDEEIELLARRLGVRSVLVAKAERFPRRFGDTITLELLHELESKNKSAFDFVVWLGPSSPLLRERDLREAIEHLDAQLNVDAVFSVSEEIQRSWVYEKTYRPSFHEIASSGATGSMHKETGAFFVMKRSAIGERGYIGNVGKPFYLHQTHAVEINTFNDWWVAEKLLRRKQILFVVAGYPALGMGHVYRSLMLAQELNDHEVQFLCTKESSSAYDYISESLFPTSIQKKDESLLDAVLGCSPDLVINDILDTSSEYIRPLKEKHIAVINFEDEGPGAESADIVINALYQESKSPNMLVGHEYFSLRSEFFTAPAYVLRESVTNVLVSFGGTDNNNLTLRCLRALLPLAPSRQFTITVLTGPGYVHRDELSSYIAGLDENDKERIDYVTKGTKKISEYMVNSDLVMTSAGRTVYELAWLRVPAIVIAANDREMKHMFAKQAGMIFLGLHSDVSDGVLARRIVEALDSSSLRKNISDGLKKYDFSKGKANILTKVVQCLEKL